MKITDLRIRAFDFNHEPAFDPTWQPAATGTHRISIVEIDTDEGITGIGSGGTLLPYASAARLLAIGQDPLAIERLPDTSATTLWPRLAREHPLELATTEPGLGTTAIVRG